jgi:2-polyprenyl-3-methyl-5-hydroxy-6-metoxy-1,4-benzoquinol methylase
MDVSTIRADFDRIAELTHSDPPCDYEHALLRRIPEGARVLEIGCGAGGFARRLAERASQVTAVDLSERMIRAARRRTQAHNISFRVADVTDWEWPVQDYDCVVSIATLHHLPFETLLANMADALRPGGTLIVHDLYLSRGALDAERSAAAVLVRALQRLTRPHPKPNPALTAAWAAHARHDVLTPFPEIRRRAVAVLPGAKVERHLLWRYTLIWRRPY